MAKWDRITEVVIATFYFVVGEIPNVSSEGQLLLPCRIFGGIYPSGFLIYPLDIKCIYYEYYANNK
ncbi:hypothetical protein BX600DRAFT_461118 [Xylariales sp. PMI_506]|nr:hypothetical protein BX600DRAFT_461118 [Xylariales sp. PMI_506]